MFLGINMFWARLRLISKMSLRRAQNIFMPKNINSITINIFLEGIEKIKTEKNDKKQSEQFSGLKYILAVFQPAKISILARKMRHNARQSDNNSSYPTQPHSIIAIKYLHHFLLHDVLFLLAKTSDKRLQCFGDILVPLSRETKLNMRFQQ